MKILLATTLLIASLYISGINAQTSVGYSAYQTCLQTKCFSLYTYCSKDKKCTKSFELVNLCSQVTPNLVSSCTSNIHNYLHVSFQQCMSQNCNYESYFSTCGINYSKIKQCMNDESSDCYKNQGGQQFAAAVDKCQTDSVYQQCKANQNYLEYYNRCSLINLYSCYDKNRSSASQTIQDLLTCKAQLLQSIITFILLASLLIIVF